jgi:hypothetical protein
MVRVVVARLICLEMAVMLLTMLVLLLLEMVLAAAAGLSHSAVAPVFLALGVTQALTTE